MLLGHVFNVEGRSGQTALVVQVRALRVLPAGVGHFVRRGYVRRRQDNRVALDHRLGDVPLAVRTGDGESLQLPVGHFLGWFIPFFQADHQSAAKMIEVAHHGVSGNRDVSQNRPAGDQAGAAILILESPQRQALAHVLFVLRVVSTPALFRDTDVHGRRAAGVGQGHRFDLLQPGICIPTAAGDQHGFHGWPQLAVVRDHHEIEG